MANVKEKQSRVFKDIDLSFTANALTGDIGKKLNANAIKQSVKSLLLTKPHEKPFHPDKGSELEKYLFEPMMPGIEISITKSIELMLENYEPRVQIISIDVNPQYDSNYYSMTLRYNIIGINEPQELTANLTRLR